jgi:hypothetical protein
MRATPEHISGYLYGSPEVPISTISVLDLANLKISAGFTEEDPALPASRWGSARRPGHAGRRALAQQDHRQYSEPGETLS